MKKDKKIRFLLSVDDGESVRHFIGMDTLREALRYLLSQMGDYTFYIDDTKTGETVAIVSKKRLAFNTEYSKAKIYSKQFILEI